MSVDGVFVDALCVKNMPCGLGKPWMPRMWVLKWEQLLFASQSPKPLSHVLKIPCWADLGDLILIAWLCIDPCVWTCKFKPTIKLHYPDLAGSISSYLISDISTTSKGAGYLMAIVNVAKNRTLTSMFQWNETASLFIAIDAGVNV